MASDDEVFIPVSRPASVLNSLLPKLICKLVDEMFTRFATIVTVTFCIAAASNAAFIKPTASVALLLTFESDPVELVVAGNSKTEFAVPLTSNVVN